MVKKSKDMILEAPEYFTAEEISQYFGSKKKGGGILDTYNLTRIDQDTSNGNISYD
jgi:hypothetical protein